MYIHQKLNKYRNHCHTELWLKNLLKQKIIAIKLIICIEIILRNSYWSHCTFFDKHRNFGFKFNV